MPIVFPSEKIARRWSGALRQRLRHAPLDAFLRAQQLELAASGAARLSNNLCRATIFLLDPAALSPDNSPLWPDGSKLGALACAVSHGLAEGIEEMGAWRIAALVSTCHMLTPRWGSLIAAKVAASAAETYHSHYMLQKRAGALDSICAEAKTLLQSQCSKALQTAIAVHLLKIEADRQLRVAEPRRQLPWERRN